MQKKSNKLKKETTASKTRKNKLHFEKSDKPIRPTNIKSMSMASGNIHKNISKQEDDNVGVEAAHKSEETVENTAHVVNQARYSQKLKSYKKVVKNDRKLAKNETDNSSNFISRFRQRQAIKKEYASVKAGNNTSNTAKTANSVGKTGKKVSEKIATFIKNNSSVYLFVGLIALLIFILSSSLTSCSLFFQSTVSGVLEASFTAEDADIKGTDEDYSELEANLRNQIAEVETNYQGYDEYRYNLDEINHNPYQLAAYLTVVFEDYKRSEVQDSILNLFEQQYNFEIKEEVETRYRTEHDRYTDDEGNTHTDSYKVAYDYYVLEVTLKNNSLESVIAGTNLTADQTERYKLLLQTRGNREDIFGEDIYANPTNDYEDYKIPGEALTDTKFAAMMQEAKKYLGYPYVWGGSSPSTSFDCSGYVSWVANHSGWNLGRCTANGLLTKCAKISEAQAEPGDLIFFKGTYDTSGASHVGIYVGDEMMIHCGNPIQFASISSSYWKKHFYTFGRLE